MDFRFKHFVRADGRPFANCPLLFGVGVHGDGLTYVRMDFSTVKPTPEELDDWAWIQAEILNLTCRMCAKPALQKCGGCGVVPYCSKACQTQHWKKPAGAHKGECAAFAALKKKKQAEGGH